MSIINVLRRMLGGAPAAQVASPPRQVSIVPAANPAPHITPDFLQLNVGWNAEPNVPEPRVAPRGRDIQLDFELGAPAEGPFDEGERGMLRFVDCSRYRLGSTNDEGWYRGQCRYSTIAPRWGEFYELVGDDPLKDQPPDWRAAGGSGTRRHFLFYFRDETFECFAEDWLIEPDHANPLRRTRGANT